MHAEEILLVASGLDLGSLHGCVVAFVWQRSRALSGKLVWAQPVSIERGALLGTLERRCGMACGISAKNVSTASFLPTSSLLHGHR